MNRKILESLAIAMMSMPVAATSVYEVSLEDLHKVSAVVVSGIIEDGKKLPGDCGVAYSVRVDRTYKGKKADGRLLKFQGFDPMQVGARYFLFMSKSEDEFRAIASTNGFDMSIRAEGLEKCKSVTPIYTVNLVGGGALKVTGTYNSSVKKAVLFNSFAITPPIGLDVTELGEFDRYDNDRLETAMAIEDFIHYMDKLSGSK